MRDIGGSCTVVDKSAGCSVVVIDGICKSSGAMLAHVRPKCLDYTYLEKKKTLTVPVNGKNVMCVKLNAFIGRVHSGYVTYLAF